MNEREPNQSEVAPEHIPTLEELHSVFGELIKDEYTVGRVREDEKGIYLFEVTIPGELEGETIEYTFTRKVKASEIDTSAVGEINVTYYKDNFPIHGTSAARWVDGKWKIFS